MSKAKLYWSIIEDMNWLKYSQERRGYEGMKVRFMREYNLDMAKKVREFVSERQNTLMRMLDQLEKKNGERYGNYGGDDSFGDMTAHVIGLGEEYYNAVMENPKLLNKLDFVECFSYALPYDDDYDMLETKYHVNFAIKSMEQVVENIGGAPANMKKDNPETYIVAGDILRRLSLLIAGDYTHAVEDLNFDRDYNKISAISTGAANCLFDYKRYGTQTYLG
jgi:hypothetical protein